MSRIATIAVLAIVATALYGQSVSVQPADKADGPHPTVKTRLEASKEIPADVTDKWMIPPQPHPFDWEPETDGVHTWEHAWEITHIKFDHGKTRDDALDIRWTWQHDLDHTGNGAGTGEYNVAADRNEPAMYLSGQRPTVLVRIQAKEKIAGVPSPPQDMRSAKMRADTATDGVFMSLEERVVNFDANGISVGDDGGEYVKFTAASAVPNQFGEYTVRYRFFVSEPKDANGQNDDRQEEVLCDTLARIDIYSVKSYPLTTWFWGQRSPQVSALAFTCYPCGCADEFDITFMTSKAAQHLHSGHGMRYDHGNGAPGFGELRTYKTKDIIPPFPETQHVGYNLRLTQYMTKQVEGVPRTTVNCYDQAYVLNALMNLADCAATEALFLDTFGYINTLAFVGGESANSPFFEDPTYVATKIVGSDDLATQFVGTRRKRSLFGNHAAVRIKASGYMADACVGPVLPTSARNLANYLGLAQDTSTLNEQSILGVPVFVPGNEKSGSAEIIS